MYLEKKFESKAVSIFDEKSIKASLMATKTQTVHDFVHEYNKTHVDKIDGDIAEPIIKQHLHNIQLAEELIKKGEDTEDAELLKIIDELVK